MRDPAVLAVYALHLAPGELASIIAAGAIVRPWAADDADAQAALDRAAKAVAQ